MSDYFQDATGHYCNRVTDPSTCCPCSHGESDTRFCTCKVSGEMAKAVRQFEHELYLESWRQFDKTIRQWVLRKHRWEQAGRAACREHHGSGPLKDGKCCFCGEEIDWEIKL